jgi:hypothetical protein
MNASWSKPRRWFEHVATCGAMLFWAIQAFGLPLAVIVNTPSTVWGWLGALFWQVLFLLALLHMWSVRRS